MLNLLSSPARNSAGRGMKNSPAELVVTILPVCSSVTFAFATGSEDPSRSLTTFPWSIRLGRDNVCAGREVATYANHGRTRHVARKIFIALRSEEHTSELQSLRQLVC